MNAPIPTHLDALSLSAQLNERMTAFALDNLYTSDQRLAAICERYWSGPADRGGLLGELWVEGAFPAELSPDSLNDLVSGGFFSAELANHLDHRGEVPRDRKLYAHQAAAIRKARVEADDGSRPALVVTAGTGTGKTESFLLPILDDLLRHSGDGQSMRCLILYPMNALVNDQVDRLYSWLQGQSNAALFHFTSETPEDRKTADGSNVPKYDPCRFRTRQQAPVWKQLTARRSMRTSSRAAPDRTSS